MNLTSVQRQYLWLAGSFPDRILVQGRGYRSTKLMYALREDQLVVFGYSNPPYFMEGRGLLRKLQERSAYVMTEMGEKAYQSMLIRGLGMKINATIREVN